MESERKESLPIRYQHEQDGKWRVRYRDRKGRIRVDKWEEGKHAPGTDGGPPPLTDGGTFRTIPKVIREAHAPVTAEKTNEPASPVANTLDTEPHPAASDTAEQAQPETTAEPEPSKMLDFPPLCDDARRGPSLDDSGGTAGSEKAPSPAPADHKMEIPVVEMLIDTMFNLGEALGGPKAPKGSAMTEGFSMDQLRQTMVESGKQIIPKADVEAGPKLTFFGSMGIYLFLCYQHEQFRENARPWYVKIREKIGLSWHRLRQKRADRKKAKARASETSKKEEAGKDA